jgi:hypothetical protein
VLNDQYHLPEFLADHRFDIALIKGTHLKPTEKWSIPNYTIYRTEGHRSPNGGPAVAVRSTVRSTPYIEQKDTDLQMEEQP